MHALAGHVPSHLAVFLLLLMAASVHPGASAAETTPLAAGVARVELTPPPAMKAALGGYGARMSRPATGVHDAVWAKAVVLQTGSRRFAVVTADVLAFPPQFKAAVMDRLVADGWQADAVILLPSHSHTSLDMMALHPGNVFGIPQVGLFQKELLEFTADRLAQVIRDAARQPVPIRAGAGGKDLPDRNRNRRGTGTHDPGLTVLRLDRSDGQPLAVLVNWTAHPTFMDEQDMLFSGDWPGHLQRTLEALIGSPVTVLFYNGAEGDQSPVPPGERLSHYENAERYGRELAIEAWRVWQSITSRPEVSCVWTHGAIALPARVAHPDFMKTGGAEYGLQPATMDQFLKQLVPDRTASTCLRLGDAVIVGVPGEMAAELGLELKRRVREATGARWVSIGGLADEWVSYLLPAAAYRNGGYEGSMSFYGEQAGPTVVDGVARIAAQLPR